MSTRGATPRDRSLVPRRSANATRVTEVLARAGVLDRRAPNVPVPPDPRPVEDESALARCGEHAAALEREQAVGEPAAARPLALEGRIDSPAGRTSVLDGFRK